MIHEAFPYLTETASDSHPCCVVSVTYDRPSYFHGGNTGSNPVGDANHLIYPQRLNFRVRRRTPQKHFNGAFDGCSLILWNDVRVPCQHTQVSVT